jgi:hypothetical protein
MRRFLAVVLALTVSVAGCCFFGEKEPLVAEHTVRRPPEGLPSGELVYLDVALIDRPPGDSFLNGELWEGGDEQGVDLDTKPVLEENGLRICQLGGLLPARLQALLTSPRSCTDPRRYRGEEPGKPIAIGVGPLRAECSFTLRLGSKEREVKLKDARCEFEVVPVIEEERIRLRFTPQVHHGKARLKPHVAREPDGELHWVVEASEPVEEFAPLRFELVVAPGEYVVLGTRLAQKDTLGHSYFLKLGDEPRQYLLVVRASRAPGSAGPDDWSNLAPPLALQAGFGAARGSPP